MQRSAARPEISRTTGTTTRGIKGENATSAAYVEDAEVEEDHHMTHQKLSWPAFLWLSWSSVGVVFGDIGTSPLYVYITVFQGLMPDGHPPERVDVLGAASLVFWTLTLIVLVKYVGVVLHADDHGQGGTFALYSLLCRRMDIKPHGARSPTGVVDTPINKSKTSSSSSAEASQMSPTGLPASTYHGSIGAPDDLRYNVTRAGEGLRGNPKGDEKGGHKVSIRSGLRRPWWRGRTALNSKVAGFIRRSSHAQVGLWGVALVATAMLIGDGVLTPAVSVLSAVSGLRVAVPSLSQDVVIGVTIVILCLVFALQRLGTGQVGRFFAPIIALWLLANACINAVTLARRGGKVFAALNPAYIGMLFARHGAAAWRALGAAMLCVTGAEALFADLGHFSQGSISAAFIFLAYPCLVVTYLGQASHVIEFPEDTDAFWKSLPSQLLYPMLVLATLATIVASQALISGVFSIVRQAMILGAFPPVRVIHTGGADVAASTQVYVPFINMVLFVLCCGVVAGFRDTVALGKAYGLAVMTDMLTTTCLVTLVMIVVWDLTMLLWLPFLCLFLVVEGTYWSSNIIKVPEGGWFTLAVALGVASMMLIWWSGSRKLGERLAALTAGAQIRLLGAPQPPRLLRVTPALPPPPPPRPPLLPPTAYDTSRRMMLRFNSLTAPQRRPPAAAVSRGSGGGGGGGSGGGGGAQRQEGSSGIAAVSAPLPWLVRKTTSVGGAGGAGARLPLPPAASMSRESRTRKADDITTTSVLAGRKWLLAPESSFPPGTLALVLPPAAAAAASAEMVEGGYEGSYGNATTADGNGRRQRNGGGSGIIIDEQQAMDEGARGTDVETGGGATTVQQGGLGGLGAAAAALPVIIPLGTRLPGIGVYYMEEKVGGGNSDLRSLPPVLVHFLRNIQALHTVCIFLAVRRLPTPTVPSHQRLHIYTPHAATPPNFYTVVARYGYMDHIDHGPRFLIELMNAIVRSLSKAMTAPPLPPLPDEQRIEGGGDGDDGNLGGGQQRSKVGSVPHDGSSRTVAQPPAGPLGYWGARRAEGGGDLAPVGPALESDELHMLHQGGEVWSENKHVGGGGGGGGAGGEGGGDGGGSGQRQPGVLSTASVTAMVETAMAAFLEAKAHGVVYYASRALIFVPARYDASLPARLIHWLLYGLSYRWLVALSYNDMERWQVPRQHLVELGMAVEI